MSAEGEQQRDSASSADPESEDDTRDLATEMATTVQLTPPEPFNFSCPADWPKWIRRFERFRVATALDSETEEYQVNSYHIR